MGSVTRLPKRMANIETLAADYDALRKQKAKIEHAHQMARVALVKALGARFEYRSSKWAVLRVPATNPVLSKERLTEALGDLEPYIDRVEYEQLRVTKAPAPLRASKG